jgi:hypothetical protein
MRKRIRTRVIRLLHLYAGASGERSISQRTLARRPRSGAREIVKASAKYKSAELPPALLVGPESTVRYSGIEVDDALAIAEQG